MIFRKEFMGNS